MNNHTLEITKIKPLSDVLPYSSMTLASTEDVTFTTTLSENAVYIFRVLATNDVGTVYTDNITLCKQIVLSFHSMYRFVNCFFRYY